MLTNLYYILSLLFTNSISLVNFCWCKNKRHFFNENICTCFNFREILTSVQSHLRKEGVSETFFRHYNGNRKWCVICTAPYSKVHIFWESHKIVRNLRLTFFDYSYATVHTLSKLKISQNVVAFSEYMNFSSANWGRGSSNPNARRTNKKKSI